MRRDPVLCDIIATTHPNIVESGDTIIVAERFF